MPIGLTVNVGLLGFNGDGGFGYALGEDTLERLLSESLPTARPSSLETKRPLAVNYLLNYNVVRLPKKHLDELSQNLGMAMREADKVDCVVSSQYLHSKSHYRMRQQGNRT